MVNWTNGLLMTMALRQRESDRLADQRAFEDRLAADDRAWAARVDAQERDEEMLDALSEARLDREAEAEEAAKARQAREDAAPWFGPTVDATSLGIADISESPLPANPDDLFGMLWPPSLLVTGGSVDDGWAAAQTISDLLGVSLVGLDLADMTRWSLPAADNALSVIFDKRDSWAVVFLASLDRPSRHGAFFAAGFIAPWEEGQGPGQVVPTMIGHGTASKKLSLTPLPCIVVAHSASGRVPATVRSWGAWLPRPKDTKTCPDCAEEVRLAARICRFCRHEFALADPETPVAAASLPQSPDAAEPDKKASAPAGDPTPAPATDTRREEPFRHASSLVKAKTDGLAAIEAHDGPAFKECAERTLELVEWKLGRDAARPFVELVTAARSGEIMQRPQSLANWWRTHLDYAIAMAGHGASRPRGVDRDGVRRA